MDQVGDSVEGIVYSNISLIGTLVGSDITNSVRTFVSYLVRIAGDSVESTDGKHSGTF